MKWIVLFWHFHKSFSENPCKCSAQNSNWYIVFLRHFWCQSMWKELQQKDGLQGRSSISYYIFQRSRSSHWKAFLKNTYHDGHKIAFSLWQKLIRIVECGILAIKKTSVKTLQIELYSVFLSMSIKHIQEKVKRKRNLTVKEKTFFYLNFSSIATLKNKDNGFLIQLCFFSLCLFWLTACIFDVFYLQTHITIMSWQECNIRIKQAPKSLMETLHRSGIPCWVVKT